MIKSEVEFNEIHRMLKSDLNTLFKLIITHRTPIAEGDVRLASVLLRKWLLDGLFSDFCGAAAIKPTFIVLDNSAVLDAIAGQPSIDYFLTGGVRFDGNDFRGVYTSSLPPQAPLIPIQSMNFIEVSLGTFLRQRRLFFEGEYFTCKELIHYTANKLGGAHLDFDRGGRQAKLDRASRHIVYGGPQPSEDFKPDAAMYFILEPEGTEVLSALHVEVIAAAMSFFQFRIDGEPYVPIVVKRSFFTTLRRFFERKQQPTFFNIEGR